MTSLKQLRQKIKRINASDDVITIYSSHVKNSEDPDDLEQDERYICDSVSHALVSFKQSIAEFFTTTDQGVIVINDLTKHYLLDCRKINVPALKQFSESVKAKTKIIFNDERVCTLIFLEFQNDQLCGSFVHRMIKPVYVEGEEVEPKKLISKEDELEIELYKWLKSNGINCERQVYNATKTSKYDIWVPGELILELKANRISGSDVCQAIRYYIESRRQVVLVGKACSPNLIGTIEEFNRYTENTSIRFVSWDLIKIYLKDCLNM